VQHADRRDRHRGIQIGGDMHENAVVDMRAAAQTRGRNGLMPIWVAERSASRGHERWMTRTKHAEARREPLRRLSDCRRWQAYPGGGDRRLVVRIELAPVDTNHALNISSGALYVNQAPRRPSTKLR
jgi:hypothetical protein